MVPIKHKFSNTIKLEIQIPTETAPMVGNHIKIIKL